MISSHNVNYKFTQIIRSRWSQSDVTDGGRADPDLKSHPDAELKKTVLWTRLFTPVNDKSSPWFPGPVEKTPVLPRFTGVIKLRLL